MEEGTTKECGMLGRRGGGGGGEAKEEGTTKKGGRRWNMPWSLYPMS